MVGFIIVPWTKKSPGRFINHHNLKTVFHRSYNKMNIFSKIHRSLCFCSLDFRLKCSLQLIDLRLKYLIWLSDKTLLNSQTLHQIFILSSSHIYSYDPFSSKKFINLPILSAVKNSCSQLDKFAITKSFRIVLIFKMLFKYMFNSKNGIKPIEKNVIYSKARPSFLTFQAKSTIFLLFHIFDLHC